MLTPYDVQLLRSAHITVDDPLTGDALLAQMRPIAAEALMRQQWERAKELERQLAALYAKYLRARWLFAVLGFIAGFAFRWF